MEYDNNIDLQTVRLTSPQSSAGDLPTRQVWHPLLWEHQLETAWHIVKARPSIINPRGATTWVPSSPLKQPPWHALRCPGVLLIVDNWKLCWLENKPNHVSFSRILNKILTRKKILKTASGKFELSVICYDQPSLFPSHLLISLWNRGIQRRW